MLLDDLYNTLTARPATRVPLEEIEQKGGWRMLLDPLSEEWHWTDLDEKRRLLLALRAGASI